MAGRIQFGLNLEFRNPQQFYRDPAKLYEDIIEHTVWAEGLGYDYIFLTEHHFTHDDWAPSPLMLLSAIAARTKRVRLSTSIMLLPFYHPVRLAEDGAVLDIISGGRYELAAGLGYRPEEFGGYGMQLLSRSRRADEMLEIIRRLWDGETVNFKGKFFQVDNVRLSPRPVQQPRPPIMVGGYAPNAVKRAARMGDGLVGVTPQTYEIYVEELRRLGKDPAKVQGNRRRRSLGVLLQRARTDVERDGPLLHAFGQHLRQVDGDLEHPAGLYRGARYRGVQEQPATADRLAGKDGRIRAQAGDAEPLRHLVLHGQRRRRPDVDHARAYRAVRDQGDAALSAVGQAKVSES